MGTIPVQTWDSSHIRSTNFSHLQNESSSSSLSRCLRLRRLCQRTLRCRYCHWNRCFDHWYRWNSCSLGRRYRRSRCPSSRCCWCSYPLEGCCPPPFEPTSRKKRSAEENDAIFTTIAAAEPASCVKQL